MLSESALHGSLIILSRVTLPPGVTALHLMFRHNRTQCMCPSGSLPLQDPMGTAEIREPICMTKSPRVVPVLQKRATPELSAGAGTPLYFSKPQWRDCLPHLLVVQLWGSAPVWVRRDKSSSLNPWIPSSTLCQGSSGLSASWNVGRCWVPSSVNQISPLLRPPPKAGADTWNPKTSQCTDSKELISFC